MSAHIELHRWIVKNMAGECLGKFESHSAAIVAIHARQADPVAYPSWADDLRITRVYSTASPLPPYRCCAHSIGLCIDVDTAIWFVDSNGRQWMTHSLESILRNIDHFTDKGDRYRMLSAVANHYGFDDLWILIRGRYFEAGQVDPSGVADDSRNRERRGVK